MRNGGASGPSRALAAPLILALLPFVLFAPIALVRRTFYFHDVQAYFFPYHAAPARMLGQGDLPLWNPHVFGGIPMLGDGQTAMFYPPNWLFFVLPGAAALNYVVLLQFAIAGVGLYAFGRSLGMWRLPAFIAAVAYMFGGFLTARVVHLSIMSGAALIPAILLCAGRLLSMESARNGARGYRRRWFAATALAVALQVVAGHPQMPVYTALAVGVYAVVRSIEEAHGRRSWHPLVRGPAAVAGAYLLGSALSAVQLVPWMEFARLSVRVAGAAFEFVFASSTSGAEWLLFIFPYLFGANGTEWFAVRPMTMEQAVRAWEHSGYVGVLPLALACVALLHFAQLTAGRPAAMASELGPSDPPSARHRWYSLLFLILLLGMGLLLAAGWHTPLSRIVYRTPVLGSLRAVERGLVLASLSLTLLAGFGLQRIVERPGRIWILCPAALIVALPVFFVWYAYQPEARLPFGIAPEDLQNLSLRLPNAYFPLLLAVASGSLLAWWSVRPGGAQAQTVAAMLVLLDLGIYAISFNPTVSPRIYEYRPHVMLAFQRDGELFRKATLLDESIELTPRSAQETLAMSWGMVHEVEDVNGFNSLQPRRYTDYLFGPQEGEVSYGYLRDRMLLRPENPVLASLNVRYVLVPTRLRIDPAAHLRPVLENADVRVYENLAVYPRAYFPARVRLESDPRAVLRHVTSRGFDGRREALVETTEPLSLKPATSAASARATRSSPTELVVSTETAEPRLLVVSEMYFPGWRAHLDTRETPIYRTNYLFRGVVVPAGRHVVRFVYRPASVLVGAGVSLMALVVVVLLLLGSPAESRRWMPSFRPKSP